MHCVPGADLKGILYELGGISLEKVFHQIHAMASNHPFERGNRRHYWPSPTRQGPGQRENQAVLLLNQFGQAVKKRKGEQHNYWHLIWFL